ncbi:MAG: hypothetical protein ACJA1A_000374 [Saprospiraceae bacterium]|jgi:hypothetical protein
MNFKERYKTYDDVKLKAVVLESYKYTDQAIKAAKEEIKSRGIEIAIVNPISIEKSVPKIDFSKLKSTILEYLPSIRFSRTEDAFDIIDSDQLNRFENEKSELLFKKLIGTFVLLIIYLWIIKFSLLKFMILESTASWDYETIYYLSSIFTLPFFALLFYFRHKIGWAGLILYLVVNNINLIVVNCKSFSFLFDNKINYFDTFEMLIASIIIGFLVLILNILMIFLMVKRGIRANIFGVSENLYFKVSFASLVFGGLLVYSNYNF